MSLLANQVEKPNVCTRKIKLKIPMPLHGHQVEESNVFTQILKRKSNILARNSSSKSNGFTRI